MRNRLIELLENCGKSQMPMVAGLELWADDIADYLLENGVVPFCCKPGDTLWIINSYANSRLEIINRMVEPVEVESVAISKDGIEIETSEAIYFPEHFGKLIFFTKREAEKVLAEVTNGTR